MCIFPPSSNTVYEWVKWRMTSGVDVKNERAEWMWRISDEDICVWQKNQLLCVFVLY